MENLPLVSVIMAVHNREMCVARAINSVLTQTYRNLELIVIDDGSSDNTRAEVERFSPPVRVISQAHAGVYVARNVALHHARGELVAFIDSDDAWMPDKLALQVPLMQRPEVGLVFGDAIHVTEPKEGAPHTGLTSFRISSPKRGRAFNHFASCNFVPTCTVLVRRSCLEEIGGFSEASNVSADYLAWFRIALRHELDFVDRPVIEYTVHPDGLSFDLGRSLEARIDLFSAELAQTTDPATRKVLRRLLFNLSLSVALAMPRGRASKMSHPLRLAWTTASKVAKLEAAPWAAAFAIYQLSMRTRRLFS
ncbi:MAG TPA: glycosyltransferase [Pyrinomonadaceae bacterium]|nr:glycosyltransferase [Pyrinomonadaceae bacterium]